MNHRERLHGKDGERGAEHLRMVSRAKSARHEGQSRGLILLISSYHNPFATQGVQDAQLRQSEPVVHEHPPEDKPKRSVSYHRFGRYLREGSRTRAGNIAVALTLSYRVNLLPAE